MQIDNNHSLRSKQGNYSPESACDRNVSQKVKASNFMLILPVNYYFSIKVSIKMFPSSSFWMKQ